MDPGASKRPPGTVLCRDCYNYRGLRSGPERRTSGPRLCAAGVDVQGIDRFRCESYVPLALVARMRERGGARPSGSGAG